MPRTLLITVSVIIFGFLSWKTLLYLHHLNFIPKGLGVWQVLYSAEKASGFGPGANEAGIIVYKMPVETQKNLNNINLNG